MKKKDIVIVVMCILVIVSSVYFIFTGFSGKKSSTQSTQVKETIDFTGNIDDAAIQKIKQRKDYGSVPMDGIGRENPFANF